MSGRERGWLLPYLLEGDSTFGTGRWAWWLNCGDEIPDGPIPQIHFRSASDPSPQHRLPDGEVLTCASTYRHLTKLVEEFGYSWGALRFLMEWMGWGLSVHDAEPSEPIPGADKILYEKFQLGRLQACPSDYFGNLMSERVGSGKWNPNAFFPTPHEVVEMMVQMVFDGDEAKNKMASVLDPCVGSGRMLLHASNFSINLVGCDIDPLCVLACKLNAALYVPWMISPRHRERMVDVDPVVVNEARVAQGHPPLPTPAKRSRTGQLFLFEEKK